MRIIKICCSHLLRGLKWRRTHSRTPTRMYRLMSIRPRNPKCNCFWRKNSWRRRRHCRGKNTGLSLKKLKSIRIHSNALKEPNTMEHLTLRKRWNHSKNRDNLYVPNIRREIQFFHRSQPRPSWYQLLKGTEATNRFCQLPTLAASWDRAEPKWRSLGIRCLLVMRIWVSITQFISRCKSG